MSDGTFSDIMAHISIIYINKHLAFEKILTDYQHGFCSRRSCEIQVVQFVRIIINLYGIINRGHKKTFDNNLIMDFAKAFDKVPHRRRLYKLDYYGISGSTYKWISSCFVGRS